MSNTNTINNASTLYTRVSMRAANNAAFKARAEVAANIGNASHLLTAYSTLVPCLACPSDVPDDIEGQDLHTFEALPRFRVLPVNRLCSARAGLSDDIDTLETQFNTATASNRSVCNAFSDFCKKHNGGNALPYGDVAAKALLRSCKAIRINTTAGTTEQAKVASIFRNSLARALYLACTGEKKEEPKADTANK